MKQNLKLREEWRGTKGGSYLYIQEGNVLRHISKYALKQTKVDESRRGPTIEYEVPINRIGEKTIYELGFSNSGYFFPRAGKVEAFTHGKYLEYPWIPDYNRMRDIESKKLKGLEIEVENVSLKEAIQELKTDYARMIDEIKEYSKKLNFEIFFTGHAQRTADIFDDLETGLFACLSLPSDEARFRSLEVPMKWIYQLWVMKLACDALFLTKIEKEEWQEKPMWRIEQGRPSPTFIASNSHSYSFWFEFQPNREAHWIGAFIGRRVPIRPDILICKGKFRDAKELRNIDLIIECKNEELNLWKQEIETQVIPYFERYRPAEMILASLKAVPDMFKQRLEDIGIKAIGNLAPDKQTEIEELKKKVKEVLD